MGLIYKYLKAVLWEKAKEKPQTEGGKQSEEGKQGFIDDLRAWLKEEKEHRQDLADGLLKKIREKLEDTKTALKENNDSEKEKCEKKEKWRERWWCKSTAFIAYGVKLTTAYVIYLLKLTPRLIVYSLTVAVAWISILVYWVARGIIKTITWFLKGFLFLVHWVLRIASSGFLLFVFPVALLLNVWQIFHNFPDLIDFLKNVDMTTIEAIIKVITAIELVAVSPMAISALALFWVLSTQIVNDYMDSLTGNFIKSLLPPDIRIGEGFVETRTILSNIAASMTSLKGSLILLLGAALLAATVSSISKPAMNDTIVNNDIYVNIEIGKSVPKNPAGNGGDKPITTWMTFPSEAKAIDWVKGEYEKDCLDSRASKNDDNQDSKNGDPDPCAVKPDKDLDKSGFLPILKKLSAYGNPDNKVELKILGFSSSSGLLSLKGNKRLKEKVEKKVKEGGKESCYERTNSNQTNVDENLRLSNAFNLCIAELRAWNVAKMLEEIIVSDETIPDHIKVIPHKWGSYSEMCRHRGFCDTKKEGGTRCYDTDLGSKNRRAEVCAIKIPGCPNFPPANRTHSSKVKAQISPEPQGETCGQCTSPVPVPCDRL